MVLISPIKLVIALIVLVGRRMDAQSAVRVGFGVVLRVELVLSKGLWIVLLRVCRDGCRVQTDEGSIHDAQLVELGLGFK